MEPKLPTPSHHAPFPFSYIIAYKDKPDRRANLAEVLNWLSAFSDVDLILIEQDKQPQAGQFFDDKPVTYHFLRTDLPFNKAWAYNVGSKLAKTNALVFGDADVIMNPLDLIRGLKALETHDCVSPYDKFIDCNAGKRSWA